MTSEGNITEITAGKGKYMLRIDGVIIKIAIGRVVWCDSASGVHWFYCELFYFVINKLQRTLLGFQEQLEYW